MITNIFPQAYNVTTAGGSPACMTAIATAHANILVMMNGDKAARQTLISMFQLNVLPAAFDSVAFQRQFAGYGVIDFPSQSNDPNCEEHVCNIEKICAVMTNVSYGATALDRLASIYNYAQAKPNSRQYQQLVRRQGNQVTNQLKEEADYWGYQTCTEFAFYQTCEVGSKCMFSQGLATLDSEVAFCLALFGIHTQTVSDNVDFSNVYYGADL
jgi:serine protease 16